MLFTVSKKNKKNKNCICAIYSQFLFLLKETVQTKEFHWFSVYIRTWLKSYPSKKINSLEYFIFKVQDQRGKGFWVGKVLGVGGDDVDKYSTLI